MLQSNQLIIASKSSMYAGSDRSHLYSPNISVMALDSKPPPRRSLICCAPKLILTMSRALCTANLFNRFSSSQHSELPRVRSCSFCCSKRCTPCQNKSRPPTCFSTDEPVCQPWLGTHFLAASTIFSILASESPLISAKLCRQQQKLRQWLMTAFSKRGPLADQKPAQVTFLVLIKKHSQVCTPPSFAFLISPVRQEAGITVKTFSKSGNVMVSATLPALIPSCCSLSIGWKSSTSSASVSCCCSLQ